MITHATSRHDHRSTPRWILPLALMFTLALLLAACGDDTAEDTTEAAPDEPEAEEPEEAPEADEPEVADEPEELIPVKIAINRNVPWLAVWVAQERGLFEEHGIDAEFVELGGGAELRAAILGGSVDYTVQSAEGSANLYQEGIRLVNLLATQGRLTWSIVIRDALADEVEPGDADALRGLTIGVTGRGAGSDMLLQAYLRENGLVPDEDVRIVAIGNYQGAVPALEGGELDGVMALEPATSQVLQAGYTFLFYGDGEVFPGADEAPMGALATLAPHLEENEDEARRVVSAVVDALNLILEEPEWFAEFSAELVGLDLETWGPVAEEQVIPFLTAEITERGWNSLSDALLDGGVLDEPVPYEEVTATQFSDIWAEFEGD